MGLSPVLIAVLWHTKVGDEVQGKDDARSLCEEEYP